MLIFLDIDGVLNDHRKWANRYSPILPGLVCHLNFILDACPDAKIVLSSAWRYAFSTVPTIQTLLACHGCNCIDRVHGATCSDEEIKTESAMPDFEDLERWRTLGLQWRRDQILKYVRECGASAYVVLDDLPIDVPNIVQTDPLVGLTAADAQRAIAVLKGAEAKQ